MTAAPRPARPVVAVVALVALVLLAAAGQRLWQGVRSAAAVTGAAEWIWAATPEAAVPLAFYAVRDFHLAELPANATLHALADEEYVVYLNGHRVGSNRYRPGAPVDAYPVAPLLVTGANRLVAELRSARGDGGFLAALTADGAPVWVSDRSWRIARRHRPGLVEGWGPLPGDEAAVSWGRPPVGRWGPVRHAADRPGAATAGDPCRPVDAVPGTATATTVRFDFGRPVTGYLRLELDPAAAAREPHPLGLVALGGDRPTAPLSPALRPLPVLPVPARPDWTDVLPRTFRHVAVTGLPGPAVATVLPVAPAALPTLPAPPDAPPPGLAGIEPPGRPSLVEVLVRKRKAGPE